MSILDAIYKQSEIVVDNLGGMEESLLLMQKQDKREYKQETDHRKYQKEYDKRKRQDESRIVNVVQRSVQQNEEQRKKQASSGAGGGGLGAGLAAAGLAGIIATAIKKYNKAASVTGGGSDAGGGGQGQAPTDGGGGGAPTATPGEIDAGEAGAIRGGLTLSSLITSFIPGVRQVQEGAEIVTDLAAGDIPGAIFSGLALIPGPPGVAAGLIDFAWHRFIKSNEKLQEENEQLARHLNKIPGIQNVDKLLESLKKMKAAVGLQSGGFAGMVPNLGQPTTGDHFYTHVDPGSFVLNRNAVAAMGFQSGGTVPVALEQGEMVFSPGTFDGHMMDLINSSIPRFQVGGIVEASHDHTGSGFSVGKDSKGRPAIFSRAAATAMLKMIKDSEGAVKSSNINSSKRSPSYNARVGGVANSNHLTGNAVDYQTGTAGWSWMKEHGAKYGWVWNNYLGPTGWHFDFKGGGSSGQPEDTGKPPKEDKEKKNEVQDTSPEAQQEDQQNEVSQPQDQFSGLFKSMGKAGESAVNYLKQVDSALGLSDMGLSVVGILKGGNPFLSMASKALGGDPAQAANTNNPMGTGGGVSAGPVPPVTSGAKGLLDFIAHYESAGSYDKIFGGENIPGLTGKTIREVVQIQKAHLKKGFESAAIGRYQMMYPDVYAQKAGLSLDDKFSAANQDKMAMVYLEEDGWSKFKAGKMSADQFADNVAGTWAALPLRSGRSKYAGVGSNAAGVDRATYMKHINASKMMKGGMIGALSGSITNDIIKFFEQSEIQNRYIATSGEPNVIMMNDEEPEESFASVSVGNNLPSFDIPPRDNCPLSMYYIYNPSFNPIGIGVS